MVKARVHLRELGLRVLRGARGLADALDPNQPARTFAVDVVAEARRRAVPVVRRPLAPRGGPRPVLEVDADDVPLRAELPREARPRVEDGGFLDRARVPQSLQGVRREDDQHATARRASRNGAQHRDILDRLASRCVEQLRVEPVVERGVGELLVEEDELVEKRDFNRVESVPLEDAKHLIEGPLLQAAGHGARALCSPPDDALQAEGSAVGQECAVHGGELEDRRPCRQPGAQRRAPVTQRNGATSRLAAGDDDRKAFSTPPAQPRTVESVAYVW